MRLQFDEFIFDAAQRQLFRGHEPLHLSPRAFDVLGLLLARRPGAVSKAEIHASVWRDAFVTDTSLTMAITEIRKRLGDDPQAPRFVRTVHRFGYAFCGQVDEGARQATTSNRPSAGDPRGTAWLVWDGRPLLLKPGENVIGRDPHSDVWLDVLGVSRRHARILVSAGAAVLEDLGSTNGTFVQSAPVTGPRPLADGHIVQLGPVTLQFRTWSDQASAATERISRRK